jgi:hypothetical protein
MVGRPSCRLWLDAAKAKPARLSLSTNTSIARTGFYPPPNSRPGVRKQRALAAVIANDKARHRILPPNHRRIISRGAFSQSLDTERTSTLSHPRSVERLWLRGVDIKSLKPARIHQNASNFFIEPRLLGAPRCRAVFQLSQTVPSDAKMHKRQSSKPHSWSDTTALYVLLLSVDLDQQRQVGVSAH